jgi:hypothetical protein
MSQASITSESNLVSFKLEDIQLLVENNEVADVTVNLDYIDDLNSRRLKNVVPIANIDVGIFFELLFL